VAPAAHSPATCEGPCLTPLPHAVAPGRACPGRTWFRSTPAFDARWSRRTRARGPSRRTDAVRLLAAYCREHDQPVLADELTRNHVRAFIADQLARCKPTTAHQRYRSLRSFFKSAREEEEIVWSPPVEMYAVNEGMEWLILTNRGRVAGIPPDRGASGADRPGLPGGPAQ